VIAIDPGHGGSDGGAMGPHATLEKDAKEKPLTELEHSVSTLRRAFDDAAGYVTAAMAA